MSPTPIGMFIRFDPQKIVLPPVFGGPPQLQQFPPTEPTLDGQSRKRKRETETPGPSSGFHNYENALRIATENEARQAGASSKKPATKRVKKSNDEPAMTNPVIVYQDRQQLIEALRECFRQGPEVDFAGNYRIQDPGVSHKQRIQTITHEIWKATGYRFTVKDHPRTKHGHKTRFWCSQDDAHRSKSSKTSMKPRTSTEGIAIAKPRYPCRSGLLISSRDEEDTDAYLVTVRMHHHVSHEPYYDSSLPPEVMQSIWDTMGWRKNVDPPTNMDPDEGDSSESESEENPSSPEESPDPPQAYQDKRRELAPAPPNPVPPLDPRVYQDRMRRHIEAIRDFCDGLEYQLPFNDYRMLEVLETEGAQFLCLVQDCLEKEGRSKGRAPALHDEQRRRAAGEKSYTTQALAN